MRILPLFIPHKGCPFKCIYCNQFSITNSQKFEPDLIKTQIEKFSRHLTDDMEIAFYGGTFTGLSDNEQKKLLEITNKYAPAVPIRISTRPDFITRQKLTFLKKYNVRTIELGIQSFSDKVLEKSKRGYSSDTAMTSCLLVKRNNIKLSIQLMPGLPGFSMDTLERTLQITKKISPEYVRIYPTVVLKNTELEKLYLENKYTPLSLDNAIDITSYIINFFKDTHISIIKSGLHSDIDDVIAGPYHHSFGELVKIKILKDKLISTFETDKTLVISNKDISLFTGFERKTIKFLKQNFDIKKLKVKFDKNLKSGSFYFSSDEPDKIW